MKLSELITNIGDDNCEVQSIATSLVKAQQKKHDCEITFATSKENGQGIMSGLIPGGKTTMVGIVVWVTRENYIKATETPSPKSSTPRKRKSNK